MVAPINPTQLTPPRVAFIDERSGAISREWYRFFLSLLTATEANQQQSDTGPNASSLLASYDALLDNLAQGVQSAPDAISITNSLDDKVNILAQTFATAPPDLGGTVTSVDVSGGTTGLTFSGGPVTTSGTITMDGTLGVANGGTGAGTAFTAGSVVFAGASGVYSQDNANLFWDDTNNRLGVGVDVPDTRLHVREDSTGNMGVLVHNRSATGTPTANLYFITGAFDLADDRYAMIRSDGTSTPTLQFWTGNGTPPSERMRVASNGLIGINRTPATYRLEIQANSPSAALQGWYCNLGAAGTRSVTFTAPTTDSASEPFYWNTGNSYAWYTGNVERVRINASGLLGVGTATPATILDVNGDVTIADKIIHSGNTNTSIRFPAADTFTVETAGSERLRVDSSGNVGVNEAAPDYKLDVNGTFGFTPGVSVTPVDNGDVVFELTNNTTLTVKAKGSDGVVRSGTIILV